MRRTTSLVATAVMGLAAVLGPATPASAATTVRGEVMCVSQASVVGVWIQAENGGSGWAAWSRRNNYTANYSYTLPNNGRYQVHVGCGGTPQNWATNNKSGYVSGTLNSFTCYDTPAARAMYLKCQRT